MYSLEQSVVKSMCIQYFRLLPLRKLVLLACLLCPIAVTSLAHSAELPVPLGKAIVNLAENASTRWAYTRETHDDIGHYVERFDPAAPRDKQWVLLRFDGEQPGAKHLKRYRKEYESLFERDAPTNVELDGLVDPATIALAAENGEILTYEFQPLAESEDDVKMVRNLVGTIVIDAERNVVLSMAIRSLREFSPEKFVKINSMSAALHFEVQNESGLVFLTESTSNTVGRFMGLTKIDEDERVQFRDFVERPSG